ncbi:energy-coupling factor ABC transporter ATP-binding protein [Halobacillus yeomjeoni]|uniref:ABC transporter ATP-binding protein n=1 Tax=Halobacillus yeomjeoni TaxID=311194 RepID=UPI001CD46070|nr:ABC transporter ATP-binding protein [Halobacillus yeomjeoni]MCA0982902.1 energy-coupling factor ABC transporter ATP-binding protein [Halobacillus yeomjeoni]
MNEPIIMTKHLSVSYEEVEEPALNDINLSIEKGSTWLILGPSGAGKSTFIHCLNGLFPRELDGEMSGHVYVNGKDTRDYHPGEISRHIGIVFQDPDTQFCMLTVEDEIAFGLENLSTPLEKMEELITESLKLVGLEHYRKSDISTLSGGEKQKLALACVLAMKPDVLILDEPTSNLDPCTAEIFTQILHRLKAQLGITLIVIEHKIEEWTELVQHSAILNQNGELFYQGTLRDGVTEHASSLKKLGVWLPYATREALKTASPLSKLPMTIDELSFKPEIVHPSDGYRGQQLLQTDNLSWHASKQKILDSVHLDIFQNEFVAIVGPNGSGKTTLSLLLAGIHSPNRGSIHLKGRPLGEWREDNLRNVIGYVFQNPEHQFITDSVFEEVAYSLKLTNKEENEVREVVFQTLKEYNLEGLENRNPFQLSQGQKRRLSVAAMTVMDQELLILDEPTFGQDWNTTERLMDVLQDKNSKGKTIVMITHDMELVDRFATRVLVMEKGKVKIDKKPDKLWKQGDLSRYHLNLPPRIQAERMRLPYVSK